MTSLEELYNDEVAEIYDIINFSGKPLTTKMNDKIAEYLTEVNAQSVLDMSCGTGAQCISLHLAGFKVQATDISPSMIKKAELKASKYDLDMSFQVADMRTVSVGKFQGIISMYNAIGHLSKDDFAATLRNASSHLEPGGVFIFDTFNEKAMNYIPAQEFVDVNITFESKSIKRITKMDFDRANASCLFLHQITIEEPEKELKTVHEDFSLTFYTAEELVALVKANGFSQVEVYDRSMFDLANISDSMSLVVARI